MGKYLKLFYDNESQQTYEISKNYYEPYVGGIYAYPKLTYNKFNYAKYFINYTNTETKLRDFRFNENFVEIEYLETDGTQGVLNTDFIPSGNDIKIEGKFNIKQFDSTNTAWAAIFTAYTDENSNCYRIIRRGTTSNDLCLNCGQRAASGGTNITINFNTDYEFVLTNTQYTFGEMSGTLKSTYGNENIKNFKIGSLHHVKHYYYKIYKNDILIHDYIPVRIGTIGYLYDKITRKLFTFTNNNAILGNDKFVQIEYLESTGTQYIDTGIIVSDNYTYEVMFNGCIRNTCILGGRTPTTRTFMIFYYGTSLRDFCMPIAQFNGIQTPFNLGDLSDNKHVVKAVISSNRCSVFIDGIQKYNNIHFDGTYISGVSCALFASKYGDNDYRELTKTKIYYFKCWQGNNIIADFIPVRVGTVGYMYDKINGKLFGNEGTGEFILGPDKNLPYDAEIEYLESSGTQYINTGLKVNNSYTFDTSIAALNNAATTYWGCRNSGSYNTRNQQCYLQNNPASLATSTIHLWTDSTSVAYHGNSWDSGVTPSVETLYTFNGITVNTNLAQLTQNITLFAFNMVGTINKSSCRIGLFRAYSNGTVVMNMIPVRIGQVGYMYDKISGKLFGNEGTGAFILGPNKNLPYDAEIEYLESTGTQKIDTLYVPIGYDNTIETKITYLGYSNKNQWLNWFTTYVNEETNVYRIIRNRNLDTQVLVYNGNKPERGALTINVTVGTDYDLKLYPSYLLVNGTRYNFPTIRGNANTNTLYLFSDLGTKIRMWGFKLTKGATVILDMIPVRVGTIGYMYDKVSGKLFGNIGTGEFVLGPDVQ